MLYQNLIKENRVSNILLAGPPGSGKTTLASVIAEEGGCKLLKVNAVTSNAAELGETLKLVRYYGSENCFLFVDELHRFNKAPWDLLLPDIETGDVRLIGATTHNPRYYIIDPLLSRCQLLSLEPLPTEIIEKALISALKDEVKGLEKRSCSAKKSIFKQLAVYQKETSEKHIIFWKLSSRDFLKKLRLMKHIKDFVEKEAFAMTVMKMNTTIRLPLLLKACAETIQTLQYTGSPKCLLVERIRDLLPAVL